MKIKDYKCKCGHDDFFFADKGNQKGIYCTNCGKWFKWADKDKQNLAMRGESTRNEWIPVSDRLPEEREWIGTKQFGTTISDEVYVTFEIPNGGRFCDHVRFQNGKLSPAERAKVNAIAKNAEPIAWMPLPETYKDGE